MRKILNFSIKLGGEELPYTIQVFGWGSVSLPTIVKIWDENKKFLRLYDTADITLPAYTTRPPADSVLITGVTNKLLYERSTANTNRNLKAGHVQDVVRLRSTSTRPDLLKWLHPISQSEITYCAEIYLDKVIRYSVRGMTLHKQTTFFKGSGLYQSGYSYSTWLEHHSHSSHDRSKGYAKQWLAHWRKYPGEGLRYEYADLFDVMDVNLSDSIEYINPYPPETSD